MYEIAHVTELELKRKETIVRWLKQKNRSLKVTKIFSCTQSTDSKILGTFVELVSGKKFFCSGKPRATSVQKVIKNRFHVLASTGVAN